MLLVRNGYVIDPADRTEGVRDLWIDEEKGIIAPAGAGKEADRVIDASGLVVSPGLVDVHVHFRDPGFTDKEDILTGAKAAAKGGFTSVVMMANTRPTIDNAETLRYVLEKGAGTGIRTYACVNVTKGMKGRELTDLRALFRQGAVGMTDDGVPILDEALVREAMRISAELGIPISFHEEDPQYIRNPGYNHGAASEHFGIYGADRMAEIAMIQRDLKLAAEEGGRIDIQHISTAEGVALVREAKAAGTDVHAEATPHHFTLTEEAAIRYETNAKMNPPLRTEADRLAIIEGLRDGTIDMIATDHAPHTEGEKAAGLTQAPSGITGLETSLALGITELVDQGYLSMQQLLHRMSTGPAQVYHLDAGTLAEGKAADLVLFDPKKRWTVTKEGFASKATNSPFIGWELTGQVQYTICGGRVIYQV
ncbi:MAG: dihydroorotase [Lachnospiraceae bacterium]|nr:dihydroorotase [Lachnospiraceae bacterium]